MFATCEENNHLNENSSSETTAFPSMNQKSANQKQNYAAGAAMFGLTAPKISLV